MITPIQHIQQRRFKPALTNPGFPTTMQLYNVVTGQNCGFLHKMF
jgi:hypothetical protein